VKELVTDSDNFAVEFPKDASPEMKSLIFGAAFLIDYMYFEKKGSKSNSN
jgi:hypothetical protein